MKQSQDGEVLWSPDQSVFFFFNFFFIGPPQTDFFLYCPLCTPPATTSAPPAILFLLPLKEYRLCGDPVGKKTHTHLG